MGPQTTHRFVRERCRTQYRCLLGTKATDRHGHIITDRMSFTDSGVSCPLARPPDVEQTRQFSASVATLMSLASPLMPHMGHVDGLALVAGNWDAFGRGGDVTIGA